MLLKSNSKYLFFFCLVYVQLNAQQNFEGYDFLQKTKEGTYYNLYAASIEFKFVENKLVYDYQILKEATYPTDKSNYTGPQTVTYSDYYTNNVQLKAKILHLSKSGHYHAKKINEFHSKTIASDGIFYEDQIQSYFLLPSFKPGDKSQLSFSCRGIDPLLTSRFIFNLEMPIEEVNYKIVIPDNVRMKFVFVGDSSGITHSIKKEKNQTVHVFNGHKRMPIDFEDQAEDIAYYTPHLFIIPISYTQAGKEISLAGTTANLFKYYNSQIKLIDASQNTELNRITDQLIQNLNDSLSKIKVIYDWVQKNIKYVAFEQGPNGFIPRPAEKILNNKYGDCKDKANLLINMLNHAKIPSYYTWVGTRSKPYSYDQLPSPHVDNHMITTLKLNGRWLFLDPTALALEYNFPSAFIQGKEALIRLSDSTYVLEKIPVVEANKNYKIDSLFLRIEQDNITGTGIQKNAGYFKENCNSTIINTNQSDNTLKKGIEIGNNKLSISNFKVQSNASQDLKFEYQLNLPNYLQNFNDELYLNLNLIKDLENKQIEIQKRKHDLTNEFRYELVQHIQLSLPPNKIIEQLPANKSYTNDQFSFEIKYARENNNIIYDKKITVNHLLLKKNDFKDWNDMLDNLNKAYLETILIKSK